MRKHDEVVNTLTIILFFVANIASSTRTPTLFNAPQTRRLAFLFDERLSMIEAVPELKFRHPLNGLVSERRIVVDLYRSRLNGSGDPRRHTAFFRIVERIITDLLMVCDVGAWSDEWPCALPGCNMIKTLMDEVRRYADEESSTATIDVIHVTLRIVRERARPNTFVPHQLHNQNQQQPQLPFAIMLALDVNGIVEFHPVVLQCEEIQASGIADSLMELSRRAGGITYRIFGQMEAALIRAVPVGGTKVCRRLNGQPLSKSHFREFISDTEYRGMFSQLYAWFVAHNYLGDRHLVLMRIVLAYDFKMQIESRICLIVDGVRTRLPALTPSPEGAAVESPTRMRRYSNRGASPPPLPFRLRRNSGSNIANRVIEYVQRQRSRQQSMDILAGLPTDT